MKKMTNFRIAHISDTHFAVEPSRLPSLLETGQFDSFFSSKNLFRPASYSPLFSRDLAEQIFLYRNTIDHILFTGDMATTGSDGDLSTASKFLIPSDSKSPFLSNSQDARIGFFQPDRISILPGNHDRYSSFPPYIPENFAFERHFEFYWKLGKKINGRIIIKNDSPNDKLAILMLDFSFSIDDIKPNSFSSWLGKGKVHHDTLYKLENIINKLKKNEIPIIIAIHFPPIQHEKIPKSLELIDSKLFRDFLIKNNIHHVFCGHVHSCLNGKHTFQDINYYISGSATEPCLNLNTNNFHIADIEINNKIIQNIHYNMMPIPAKL